MHVDNTNKDILVLGKGPTRDLDNTAITVNTKFCIDFTQSVKNFVLSLYYNGSNGFFFVNTIKMYKFKAKILK